MKIFYSWQSDSPNKTNRGFIRDALEEAIKLASQDLDIEDAERPEVDEATTGTKGMVDITASILQKISACAIYVADVTPIAHTRKKKALPNPNVMYELGWASHRPGYDFIIAIMNAHKNKGPNALPFDLRGRRVLTYTLAPDAPADERKRAKTALIKALTGAIKENMPGIEIIVDAVSPIVLSPADPTDFTIWPEHNHILQVPNSFGRLERVQIEPGPRAYVRIRPASWSAGHPPDAILIGKATPYVTPQSGAANSGSFGTCELGFVRYWYSVAPRDEQRFTSSLALYLDEEGEYWIADGTVFASEKNGLFFFVNRLLRCWYRVTLTALQQLDQLGASPRRLIEVGINGMQGAIYPQEEQFLAGPQSRKQKVQRSLELPEWNAENLLDLIHPAFNTLRSAFSLEQVTREGLHNHLAGL